MTDYDVAQLARLEPAYQERLGLNTAPFPPTHEDRFLYLDAERRQRLQMLQHLTQYSNLLLMIVGDRGIGKTSLLDRFVAEAKPEWQIARIQANALMDADQLLYDIALGFGLSAPPHDPSSLQDALFQHLLKLREQDRTPILIIDDAHELPRDALLAVFHLADAETAEGNLLRVILACEPQIETMLADTAFAPLRERITHTLDIPPFDKTGTAEYLAHRLAVAGYSGASPFDDKALQQIWQAAEGNPARINEAAHLWLSDGGARELPSPWEGDGKEAATETGPTFLQRLPRGQIAAASGIALLLILALLFQDRINTLFEEPATPAETQPPASAHTSPAPVEEPARPDAQPIGGPPATTENPSAENAPEETAGVSPAAPEPEAATPATEDTPAEPSPVPEETPAPPPPAIPIIERIEPAIIDGSRKPVTLTLHGKGFTADSRVEVVWKDGRRFLPAERVEWIDTRTGRITLVPGISDDTWQVRIHGPADTVSEPASFRVRAAVTTPSARDTGTPKTLWDRQWIAQQPGDHFTLQLLATRQRDNVSRFVEQHGLKGLAVAFETRRNGQTWYSVIVGSYPDRQQAQQAFSQLPASVQKLQPWIRRFDGIQQAMQETRTRQATPLPIHLPPPDTLNPADHLSWLWSRDPSHVTLQLMAGHDEQGIRRFLRQHRLLGKAAWYRTVRNGRPWFVVVYGDYADRRAARAAIDKLPPALQHLKPWPRTFGDIHAELNRNGVTER